MGDLSDQRRDYTLGGLAEADVPDEPWSLFDRWYAEAADLYEPNAMVLATADGSGQPDVRTVLLKSYDERGLVFFTGLDSAKGRQLAENPLCGVVFPWFELQRQVRFTGVASELARDEVGAYFASRPRGSQLGAWASIEAGGQSQVVAGREALDGALAEVTSRFPDDVPTPESWGGFRIAVDSVEFWQGRSGRLHDRLRFERGNGGWRRVRLAP